ncbi:NAD(P)/FAD-dependent oxidoreductase [Litorimonas sp.]|uniref:NAD(P)/FAD-dependent oxidoreductase n=1 Tax=Litorimonas sp. TaxID=1892381 RepID=UPI003A841E72
MKPLLHSRAAPISRQRIAIIGSGISGLSAAWLLHPHHDITVYEANDYIGGHSHTVDIETGGKTLPVDTGFIVYNNRNYPNLSALFETLGVPTWETDMSFGASLNDGALEYAGGTKGGLFAQKSNLLRPRYWSMLRELMRFYKNADRYRLEPEFASLPLRSLLQNEHYSDAFIEDHLAPMGAAIWSSDSQEILDFPAQSFMRFFHNHGLDRLNDAPVWRTVKGGSREYVKKLCAGFTDKIRLSEPVQLVEGRTIITKSDKQTFDHILFACHSDQALTLLQTPDSEQGRILSAMRYRPNDVVLHHDENLMPKRKKAWASWNYLSRDDAQGPPAVSYWMNRLQHVPTDTPVIVTLNPDRHINPSKIWAKFSYDHPVFDMAAEEAKSDIWTVQGQNGYWFAGAYLGDGFHEDGIQAGLFAAEQIGGIKRPWEKPGQTARLRLDKFVPKTDKMVA